MSAAVFLACLVAKLATDVKLDIRPEEALLGLLTWTASPLISDSYSYQLVMW